MNIFEIIGMFVIYLFVGIGIIILSSYIIWWFIQKLLKIFKVYKLFIEFVFEYKQFKNYINDRNK